MNVKMRWWIHQFCGQTSFVALVNAVSYSHIHQFRDGDAAMPATQAGPEEVAQLGHHEPRRRTSKAPTEG